MKYCPKSTECFAVPSEEEEGPETYQSLTNAARAVENLRGILDYEGCFDIFLLKLLHVSFFFSIFVLLSLLVQGFFSLVETQGMSALDVC